VAARKESEEGPMAQGQRGLASYIKES